MSTGIEMFDINPCLDIDSHCSEGLIPEVSREDYASQALGLWSTRQSPFCENIVEIPEDTINLKEGYQCLTCYIWLPEEYNVADIDPEVILLNGKIGVASIEIKDELQLLIAKFSWSQVEEMLKPGAFEFIVSGQLFDGTPFDSKDTVIITD
jgi:hypothetical protein